MALDFSKGLMNATLWLAVISVRFGWGVDYASPNQRALVPEGKVQCRFDKRVTDV